MLKTIIWVLRLCNWLNWAVAALLTLLLTFIAIDPETFRNQFIQGLGIAEGETALIWLVGSCAMIIVVAVAAHVILIRLVHMLRDAQAGAAFTLINAQRLATIAWALLAINVIDLAFGQLSIWASAESGEYFGWSLSFTGWLAVPLLLVLSRLFREGAAMRDDLEGTV